MILNESQLILRGANLKKANLAGSRLRLANFQNADLREANLQNSNLSGAFLLQADLKGANLSAAILQGANLSDAKLDNAVLRGADLSPGMFMGHELHFDKMIFQIPRWRRSNYFFQQTRKTILHNANLGDADLRWGDFSNADLKGASLREANLFRTILRGANLRDVDFDGACLYETNLNSANLDDAKFGHSKLKSSYFLNVDLSKSKGLNQVRHDGPSTISLDTISRSQGHIPASFFEGAGTPDSLIALIETLSPDDFEFTTCYINYSSADLEFVKKMQLDLQQEGVRTWLVPDDMNIGDPEQPRMDRGIQPSDKVLLVLSKDSVNSDWIELEVNQTLEQERRIYEDLGDDDVPIQILFPIMIDNSISEAKQFWAKNISKQRHIENFAEWQNKTSYKSAFDRLLIELQNTPQHE